MPTPKPARVPKTAHRIKRFSLVSTAAQQEMYQALTALQRSKARAFSGAEVAEIAVCLAAGESVPVICASPSRGARLVRNGGSILSAKRRGIGAATIASAAALLNDAKANATIVCAGKIDAQPEAQQDFKAAIQFAARYKLPILFVVGNRLVPAQTQIVDLRTLYAEYGIPVFSVDANDAIAAYRVATEALHNARYLRGPCVIEALTLEPENGTAREPRKLLAAYMERHGNLPE